MEGAEDVCIRCVLSSYLIGSLIDLVPSIHAPTSRHLHATISILPMKETATEVPAAVPRSCAAHSDGYPVGTTHLIHIPTSRYRCVRLRFTAFCPCRPYSSSLLPLSPLSGRCRVHLRCAHGRALPQICAVAARRSKRAGRRSGRQAGKRAGR